MSFDLDRFVKAQQNTYDRALSELIAGRKQSHWMWFIFPQIQGLGRSDTARFYAVSGRPEAEAYLAHPVLGPRLKECTQAMLDHPTLTAHDILGSPDDLKFRSSMTLFAAVADQNALFQTALRQFYNGAQDRETLSVISGS
ncbi:DUF1810 domain-containing protein [Agrobacterium sp. CNPSo 3708]|uniref:DUF1810 domain-containing protein n=1 Tax=Agrobacterium sp. CNPSo 3708 TaxID=3028150 RepID=UPI0023647FF8|nr:DUF1810 domain-containing protein [Agrobacterium sp. CNPSo 3708]MDD1499136.1 DUF1810 domain-containing protein [Agrobacterium sp. CNPSo 3708]